MHLPFTDATLSFALPFPSLSLPLRIGVVACVAVSTLALIVWLYRRELQHVPPRTARVLLGLRLLLVGMLAGLLLLDPALTRTRTEEVPGRVLVAVDLSDSMRISDPNRPLGEKLRLAMQLNLVQDLAGDSELSSWAADADVGRKPLFGSEGERTRYEEVLKRIDTTSRLELARRLLFERDLVSTLKSKHQVEIVGFGQKLEPFRTEARTNPSTIKDTSASNSLICTDLKLPLTRAADGENESSKLLGVILVTDGRHNWGTSPLPRARELGERMAPVHSIVMAPRDAPADVAIVSARAAAGTVFKGSTVPVDVAVRVTAWQPGPITVTLENPDSKQPPQVETIEHAGPDATYQLTLKAKLDNPGPQRLVIHADAGKDDRFPENNRRTARVNVVKDRARVMLIDGEARWEFHYLHTCLGRDPNMDVRSIVFRQPRIGVVKESELRASGVPARSLPEDLTILAGYDTVVIGDVELVQMTTAQRQQLEKYVSESGGTLVLSAGKRAMPLAYMQDDEPLRKLLPIRDPLTVDSVEGFPVELTPAGDRIWFLTMADTNGESRAAWDRFPLQHWCVTGTPKDGAEVLATGPQGQPIITRQSFGFGRVLFVGLDATWRWRFKTGDYFHHRFWSQVAQWASSDRLLPVSNAAGTIRFGPREPVYRGGQDVEVVVRIAESLKPLPPQARKAVRIVRLPETVGGKEDQEALVPLTTAEGRPRDLEARISGLLPGKYAVELDIPELASELVGPPGSDGRAAKLRAAFEVVPPDSEELIDLSANITLLDELAKVSGGTVVTPATASTLVERLAERSATREVTLLRPVRQSWLTLAVLLAVLAAEWIVRKWAGLP